MPVPAAPVSSPVPSHVLRTMTLATGALAVTGAACLAWAAGYEVGAFRLRRVDVPLLARGERPLRVLHLSDMHLTPSNTRRIEWVRGLAALEPDLVVDTGDNLAHVDAVPSALKALEPLLERPGAFVLGSNDYYAAVPKNPLVYFMGPTEVRAKAVPLPTGTLVSGLRDAGWIDLTNRRDVLEVAGRTIQLVGVDDPHIKRDRFPAPAPTSGHFRGKPPSEPPQERRFRGKVPSAELALGVTHAPYRRVLDQMTAEGSDLVLAGHTHGGQVCVPFYGALVTNCDLPRRYAKGLNRWALDEHSTWLHVSAGLGTSPFAPIRFACPPEATLLTLVPRD